MKYKKYQNKQQSQIMNKLGELNRVFRNISDKKMCLVPEPMKKDCCGEIIKAHTVPMGSLKYIAPEGSIYGYISDVIPSVYEMYNTGKSEPRLMSIGNASTILGFCKMHDDKLFSKIENQNIIYTQEQCFLLAYRALAREVYWERASSEIVRSQKRNYQKIVRALPEYLLAGLRSFEPYKKIFDTFLLNKQFIETRAYIVQLYSPPPIMGSAAVIPVYDFQGNKLQDLGDLITTPCMLWFTSFCSGRCGYIIFTWLQECNNICQRFINSLRILPKHRITDALVRLCFEFCENIYINPEWWQRLGNREKTSLTKRHNMNIRPKSKMDPSCLVDDGIIYDNWPISEMKIVGF